jgi:hypothetical protein
MWGITHMQRFRPISIHLGTVDQMRVEELIRDFFKKNPKPTDKQLRELALSVGMNLEQLKENVYRMFSQLLQAS